MQEDRVRGVFSSPYVLEQIRSDGDLYNKRSLTATKINAAIKTKI
jgi:hypothetical protein